MKKSAIAVAVVLCFVLISSRPADTCGPFFSTLVFTRAHGPDKPLSAFLQGRVGIVLPTWYRAYLVLAYRQFAGKPLSEVEQRSVTGMWGVNGPMVQPWTNVVDEWLQTRNKFTSAPPTGSIKKYGAQFEYGSYVNCAPPGFKTATLTLRDRAQKFGIASDDLKEWIRGQDAVFQNCGESNGPMVLTELSGDRNPLLRADRAYQIAAAHFYLSDWQAAEKGFTTIAADPSSPWRDIAPYMVARSVLRKSTTVVPPEKSGETPSFDPLEMKRAEAMFKAILADPSRKSLQSDVKRMLAFIAFRLHSRERRSELARDIASGGSGSNLGQDLRDYTLLLDKALDEEPDFPNVQRWGREYDAKLADWKAARYEELDDERGEDLGDWVITVQSAATNAREHAVDKWRQTKSVGWLVAALMKVDYKSAAVAQLLNAGAKVNAQSPAYGAVAYQRARLMNASGDFRNARKVLNEAFSHSAELPPSALNLLEDERMKAAASVAEFASLVGRKPVEFADQEFRWWSTEEEEDGRYDCIGENCTSVFYGGRRDKKGEPREFLRQFDSDTARVLNVGLPMSTLIEISMSEKVPNNLRKRLALATWTRGVLLEDWSGAKMTSELAISALPELSSYVNSYLKATSTEERQFAGAYAILHFPGFRPYVDADTPRTTSIEKIDSYSDNWWCEYTGLKGRWYSMQDDPEDGTPEASENVAFLTENDRKIVDKQNEKLRKIDAGATHLPRVVIAWAKTHKDDPRVPEALHLAVRATRYGCFKGDKNPYSREAFTMLHKNYPKSEWAKKTPYWFH